MKPEKLKISPIDARIIVQGDACEFDIIYDKIINHTRWSVVHEVVIKRLSDGKFFKDIYSRGATEHQEELPYEYDNPNFIEVFPVQKTITVYE